MTPGRNFTAPYDSTTKAVTAVVCVLLAVVAWMVHIVFIAPLFPVLILLAYAWSPRGYAVTGDSLVIKRLIGNVRVPLAAIREIQPGTPDDFTGCIRIAGSGGVFGYYGLFRTAKLGKCSWYVTDRAKTVIVKTDNKTLVLSPGDVQEFVAAAGVPASVTGSDNAPLFQTGRNIAGIAIGVAVGGLALAFAAFAILYSPGPPSYTLTATELTIHDKFYPVTLHAAAIDVPNIRAVDLTQDSEWRPTLRTNGFANPHYQSGWFRVANGKTVRLYRAGGRRLILIPAKDGGSPVLYQAADPERFIQMLHDVWARRQADK
ncbi:MAG: PH domain-containing protein [Bryobacteraceae bacterium]